MPCRYGLIVYNQLVKNPPAMWETWVRSLGWEDPLEKGRATHSSILAWRILRTVQSMGSQRVGHDRATFPFHSFTVRCKHTDADTFVSGQHAQSQAALLATQGRTGLLCPWDLGVERLGAGASLIARA